MKFTWVLVIILIDTKYILYNIFYKVYSIEYIKMYQKRILLKKKVMNGVPCFCQTVMSGRFGFAKHVMSEILPGKKVAHS